MIRTEDLFSLVVVCPAEKVHTVGRIQVPVAAAQWVSLLSAPDHSGRALCIYLHHLDCRKWKVSIY